MRECKQTVWAYCARKIYTRFCQLLRMPKITLTQRMRATKLVMQIRELTETVQT